MRRALVLTVGCLALLAPSAAKADVILFEGSARGVNLYERLDHQDSQAVEATPVYLSIEMHGARGPHSQTAEAHGTAVIERPDGSWTTIALEGPMYPPEGSGGLVHVAGLGDDDSLYCFRIWDLADAPTPRPDRIIAAFEPLDRFTEGFLAFPSSPALYDICYTLDYRTDWVNDGDFRFSTVL